MSTTTVVRKKTSTTNMPNINVAPAERLHVEYRDRNGSVSRREVVVIESTPTHLGVWDMTPSKTGYKSFRKNSIISISRMVLQPIYQAK